MNLEDISAPRASRSPQRVIEALDCPVMYGDQHGTAIVALAALKGAVTVQDRDISKLRVVISGAGAAGRLATELPPARHGHHPDRPRHPRSRLLLAEASNRQKPPGSSAMPETTPLDAVYQKLLRDTTRAGGRPGRTIGYDSNARRGGRHPVHRHFGPVTYRTRRPPRYKPHLKAPLDTERRRLLTRSRDFSR